MLKGLPNRTHVTRCFVLIEKADDQRSARARLRERFKGSKAFLAGRVLEPGSFDDWRVQVFYREDGFPPELTLSLRQAFVDRDVLDRCELVAQDASELVLQ